MKAKMFYGVVFLSLFCQFGNAQTITMSEFLDSVKETHPLFEKEALSAQIEMREQERLLGSQDWVVSSSPFYTYQELVATSSFSPEKMHVTGAGVAVEKPFWKTGGRFSLSWSSDFTDQEIPDIVIPIPPEPIVIPAGPSRFYQNKTYLTYSQPLLQNRGGKLDRLNYELSKYTVESTELVALENREGLCLNLALRFLDWVLLSEQGRIANERLSLAEEQLRQTKRKRAAHLVDQVDVLRAQDAVRIARQGILLIESQWKSRQAELAVLAQSQELYEMSPDFNLYGLETLPDPDEAVSTLKEQSRILKALTIRREQLSRLTEGFAETRRPQLLLSVSAGLQGGDEELGGSFDLDKPDLSAALSFRYPLGNRSAQAEVEKTALQRRQIEKEIENVTLDLEAAVRNLLISIKEMEKALALNQEQIESAKAKTKEELRLYNQGRGVLTFVIQSRDNEEQAKLTYAQNSAAYHKLVLQYRALADELLQP